MEEKIMKKLKCISGGAKGADKLFGRIFGGDCIHILPTRRNEDFGQCLTYVPSTEDFEEATSMYKQACKFLGRNETSRDYIRRLTLRSVMQVFLPQGKGTTDFVLAIGKTAKVISKGSQTQFTFIDGGTAYASTCGVFAKIPVFLINVENDRMKLMKWDSSKGNLVSCPIAELKEVISNSNSFSGIGTRNLTDEQLVRLEKNIRFLFD